MSHLVYTYASPHGQMVTWASLRFVPVCVWRLLQPGQTSVLFRKGTHWEVTRPAPPTRRWCLSGTYQAKVGGDCLWVSVPNFSPCTAVLVATHLPFTAVVPRGSGLLVRATYR